MLRVIVLNVCIAVVLGVGLLSAQTISLATPGASPGESTTVLGAGFTSGERVALLLGSHALGSAIADDGGGFVKQIEIPATTPVSDQHLRAMGSGGKSAELTISVFANWPMFKNQTSRLSSNP